MSEDNKNDKKSESAAKSLEKFSEEEQKEIIAKFKTQLAAEDEDAIMLYASLSKQLL